MIVSRSRMPMFDDNANLPQLSATVLEHLRWGPAVPPVSLARDCICLIYAHCRLVLQEYGTTLPRYLSSSTNVRDPEAYFPG